MAGRVRGSGKGTADASGLPPIFAAEVAGRDRDGDLLVKPLDWTDGEPPTLYLHNKKRDKIQPGIGDHVLVKIDRIANARDFSSIYVRAIKLLGAKPQQIIGVFRANPNGSGRMIPIDKKALGREIAISAADSSGAEDGELIAIETLRDSNLGLKSGRVLERLGNVSSEKAASLIAIHAHAIPNVFSPSTLAEANAAKPATMKGREDWRELPLITIDPIDAKDHDDAVYAEADPNSANPEGYILSIAIADVAAYVTPGSALDSEAEERGNSVYFPDRVVPMLPERISNDLCSLIADKDRPALAVRITIDASGKKLKHQFHRIMMRSHAKLAYEQAQAAIDGEKNPLTDALLEPVLKPLWAAYHALQKARAVREPLDLELPERKLLLDQDGKLIDVVLKDRLDAHRLIEEMMILANVCAAETLQEKRQLLLYRIHDEPSLSKMESLRAFLKTIDIELAKAGSLKPAIFNRTLLRVADHESGQLVNEMVLRSQAQAVYAPDNIGHFGLNLRNYAHFTSPIRRYSDLIVHRALIKSLGLGKDGLPEVSLDHLRNLGERISNTERRAMMAERDTYDRLIAAHLASQIGAKFPGRISGVTKSGLFVKLNKTGADGFVPASTLGADFFRYDEASQALIGDRTGEGFRLGDMVEVKLVEAAPMAGALRFEILSEGRLMKPAGGKNPRGRRHFEGQPKGGFKAPRKNGRTKKLGRSSRGR
jgi:ribonuclease R